MHLATLKLIECWIKVCLFPKLKLKDAMIFINSLKLGLLSPLKGYSYVPHNQGQKGTAVHGKEHSLQVFLPDCSKSGCSSLVTPLTLLPSSTFFRCWNEAWNWTSDAYRLEWKSETLNLEFLVRFLIRYWQRYWIFKKWRFFLGLPWLKISQEFA